MPSTLDLDITSAGLLALVSHATRRADLDTIPGSLFGGDTLKIFLKKEKFPGIQGFCSRGDMKTTEQVYICTYAIECTHAGADANKGFFVFPGLWTRVPSCRGLGPSCRSLA
jgi:hypothetical protein